MFRCNCSIREQGGDSKAAGKHRSFATERGGSGGGGGDDGGCGGDSRPATSGSAVQPSKPPPLMTGHGNRGARLPTLLLAMATAMAVISQLLVTSTEEEMTVLNISASAVARTSATQGFTVGTKPATPSGTQRTEKSRRLGPLGDRIQRF